MEKVNRFGYLLVGAATITGFYGIFTEDSLAVTAGMFGLIGAGKLAFYSKKDSGSSDFEDNRFGGGLEDDL